MHFLTIICFLFAVITVGASPPLPMNGALTILRVKAAQARGEIQLGNCIGANTMLPLCDTNSILPMLSRGLTLKYLAIGRGTQNYTCAPGHESALPTAKGAVATLFDASCIASRSPTILHELPLVLSGVSSNTSVSLPDQLTARKSNALVLGEHHFTGRAPPCLIYGLEGINIGSSTRKMRAKYIVLILLVASHRLSAKVRKRALG
ncbi:LOW QUALITY PROTEIN: uncharacterized protein ACLA_073850 [Aspergillus clavatus NRRL 1]|uniref:Uncharacterized protein n=1 Tax=Aspergillus clavatus (strain ATCC 1007 / CBS 513.65 / DSM 816 / NCTC 3887 / NRRL 1 / QM 1276 / 107) TaxID=344612 RepID=A1C7H8_ASPCL|nr:LOW QUALITY PROTEIN: uncharacterized protein ACLA_073850 [Aspergillus clavatus NRRL 1]EAW14349.1 conserved hypothetical protein [Aspergillus clavatus NRRL 1]